MGQTPSAQWLLYKPKFIQGTVILITGASSGLGKNLALKYAAKGANLILSGRNEKALLQVTEQCRKVAMP